LDPLAATAVILGLMAAIVIGFRLFIRRPAGLTGEDPPGLRTVAVFSGNDPELFADDAPEEPYVGLRLFGSLCDALAANGLGIENRGTIQYAQRAECVVGDERFALVLEWIDHRWVAGVEWVPSRAAERRHLALTAQVFSLPDSPQLRRLLVALDRSLRGDGRLSAVRWYRKQDWLAEDTTKPADAPLES